jgi:hypothetical protein
MEKAKTIPVSRALAERQSERGLIQAAECRIWPGEQAGRLWEPAARPPAFQWLASACEGRQNQLEAEYQAPREENAATAI